MRLCRKTTRSSPRLAQYSASPSDFGRAEPDRASEQRAEYVGDRRRPEPHLEEDDQQREHDAEQHVRHQPPSVRGWT